MERQLLLSIVLPASIAAVVMVVGWRPWRRSTPVRNGHWSVPIAFGIGFIVSFFIEDGLPRWPFDRYQWIGPLAAGAAAAGFAHALTPRRWWSVVLIAVATAVLSGALIAPPGWTTIAARIGLALIVLASVLLLEPLAARRPGPLIPFVLIISFTTTSILFFESGFAKLSIVCGAMSGISTASFLLALLNRNFTLARGGAVWIGALLPALLLIGHAYDQAELPLVCFVLPLAAPLTLWLAEIRRFKRWGPTRAALVATVVALLCNAAALGIALQAGADEGDEDDSGYDIGDYGGY